MSSRSISQIRRYRALQLGQLSPGQVEDADASSHTVNSPPCQSGLASHRSTLHRLSWGLVPVSVQSSSVSDHVTLYRHSHTCPVPTRSPVASSVTSPSCFTSSGTASVPLNHTGYGQTAYGLPLDQTPRSPSLKRSTTRISTYRHRVPTDRSYILTCRRPDVIDSPDYPTSVPCY